jgi:hypothetical protein
MKALAIGALLTLTLTACSDRVRENCTRNKTLGTVTSSPVKCKL